jgi:hypothetical protein
MKKVFIACFLAILMLMVPITISVKTVNISNIDDETPQFYITEEGLKIINTFIDEQFEGDNWATAHDIVNNIIKQDLEVDIISLADAIVEHGFEPINETDLNNVASIDELNQLLEEHWNIINGEFIRNIFGELIDKIINLIQDRLGWIYDFFYKSVDIITKSIDLFYDYIQESLLFIAVLIVKVVNHILSIPNFISDLIKDIFQGNEFIDDLVNFTEVFAGDFANLVQEVINFVTNQQLKEYLTDIKEYAEWLGEKPWDDPILVKGVVRKNLGYFSGATVTCRGQSSVTDSNGEFSFYVDPNPDGESIPKNEYYGMHNCAITVTHNDKVLKHTPKLLSYCFSGGNITWQFLVIKVKPKNTGIRPILFENFNLLLERIRIFLSNFFRNTNRADLLSI